MTTELTVEQLFPSVITTLCVPAQSPVAVVVVCPSVHRYEYGKEPPPTMTVTLPSQIPLQLAPFEEIIALARGLGSLIVTEAPVMQPLASSTVIEYVPPHNPKTVVTFTPTVSEPAVQK